MSFRNALLARRRRLRSFASGTLAALPAALWGGLGLLLLGSHAATAAPATLQSAPAEIPASWFFSGADRPKALKALEGRPAPEIATQAWIGDEASVAGSRGKVVVVDFWATWCGPCMAAIPETVAMVKKLGDQGLVVIGVHDQNSGWDKAATVVRDKGINYPVAKDSGESVKRYRLEFWPTYVVIDRAGLVRAAGLLPDRVDDVVQMLLAEPPPADLAGDDQPKGDLGPPEWYYGGATRPGWLRAAEGRVLPPLAVARQPGEPRWFGRALRDEECKGRVMVVHFMTSGSELSRRQLLEIAALQPEFGPQGVAFVGVCDARADWAAAQASFKEAGLTLSIVQDAPTPPSGGAAVAPGGTAAPASGPAAAAQPIELEDLDFDDGEIPVAAPNRGAAAPPTAAGAASGASAAPPPPPSPFGATAAALGLRLMPITIVVDRNGRVAAAGVRADQVKAVVNHLLARATETGAPPAAPSRSP